MATIQTRGSRHRAIVRYKGVYDSETFSTITAARAWGKAREAEIDAGAVGAVPDKTFGQLLERYRDEVSVGKRGARGEQIRINRLLKDSIANKRLASLSSVDFADWRNARLRSVSGATVTREMTVMSAACSWAVNECRWLQSNPVKGVSRPASTPPRDRLITQDEIDRVCFTLGYAPDATLDTMTSRIGAMFMFAIETAMRMGEIVALRQADLDLDRKFLRVRAEEVGAGKNRAARRSVPLSDEAVRILRQLPENDRVFGISSTASADQMFRRAVRKAMIEGLHFHDTRHEGITRLARKLDVLPLARSIGHGNLNELMTYYNETAEDIAKQL